MVHVPYTDITERINEPPKWWADGVPRYNKFEPRFITVYYPACLLVRGKCQSCHAGFIVGIAGGVPQLIKNEQELGDFHAGDAPYHESAKGDPRCSGNWSSLLITEVLEAWWRAPNQVDRSPETYDHGGMPSGVGRLWLSILTLRRKRDPVPGTRMRHSGNWTRLPSLEGPKDFYGSIR